MHGWSQGFVIIKEKHEHGLFHKKSVYKGYLQSARNLSGFSLNDTFIREYAPGDRVKARYHMVTAEHGRNKGEEYLEFEILEEE